MNYKKDFPIFENNPKLVYLDSASTSQKPKTVINSIKHFYENTNANIHRGIYCLSEQATKKYNDSRKIIAKFINADSNEIIFTKNTTESINLLSCSIKNLISQGKNEILLTEMEHHSNLVPWQQFTKKHNFKLKFIPITENFELDYSKAEKLITEKTAILSVTHISNVFGTINNVERLIKSAKKKNVLTIVDVAQSIPHTKIDAKKIDCDFLVYSGHKVFAPLGIGILYGKKELLNKMDPFQFGGGMIQSVSYESSTWKNSPEKFEAGTQNIAGAIALAESIRYIEGIGFENIQSHEKELLKYVLEKLSRIDGIKIYSPGQEKSSAIVSFNLKKIHPHDVASIVDEDEIAIRAGHHCCMPLMKKLGIPGTCRISISIYNSKHDIDRLIESLNKVNKIFNKK